MSRPDRKIRSTRVLGALFVLAGFGAIGAGWYGMISQDQSVDRQFPYLISGGAAGIALLLFGVALLVIAQIRTERRRLSVALERFRPAGRLVGSMPPTPEAEGSAFPGRYLKMFGLAVCAAGFASIAIGWNGSARLTVVDQQFPFLLSGGVLGIANPSCGRRPNRSTMKSCNVHRTPFGRVCGSYCWSAVTPAHLAVGSPSGPWWTGGRWTTGSCWRDRPPTTGPSAR